jgi:hypothetical protein
MGDAPEPHASLMCCNRRRARSCVFDDFVMRDAITETRNLCVSVLRVGASRMSLSHIVKAKFQMLGKYMCVFI